MVTSTRPSHVALAIGMLFLIAGCLDGAEPVDENGGDTAISDPTPEGTGPEPPREPGENRPSVVIAGPPIGGDVDEFDEFNTGQCVSVLLSEPFDEDALVTRVSVGPVGGFVRDDGNCDRRRPSCDDFVFRTGRGDECEVGLRWLPESEGLTGALTLSFSATCRTNTVRFCDELDASPPPDGVLVTFASSLELAADRSEPPDSDPTEQDREPGENGTDGEDGSDDTSDGDDDGGDDENDENDSGNGSGDDGEDGT